MKATRWITMACMMGLVCAPSAQAADAPEKKNVLASVDIQIYGYARLDAAFDTSRVFPGNYALNVKSEAGFNDDNQLSITANQSRLGFNLAGPEAAGVKTAGKFEMDFYGGGAENKSNLMLRQAYLELTWPTANLSRLAGQTWDVFAPGLPDSVNYSVWETMGEIGYRHPQLRLTHTLKMGEKASLATKAALSRNMGHAVSVSGTDSGTDSGRPAFQGSITLTSPLWTPAPAVFTLSGVASQHEYDVNAQNLDSKEYTTWGGSIDIQLPLVSGVVLKGNAWKGADLETYLGQYQQGFNAVGRETVEARGGWVQLGLGPWARTKFNLGASIEQPRYDQIPDVTPVSSSWRIQNSAIYANAIHDVTGNVQAALEVAQLRTLYKQIAAGDAVRVQLAMIYNF